MTYTAKGTGLKVSQWVVGVYVSQYIQTTLTYVNFHAIRWSHDPYGDGIGVTFNNNTISLPAGKYYIQAMLHAYESSSQTLSLTYGVYHNGNQIGYEGHITTYDPTSPPPLKDQTARAYLETNTTTSIQVGGTSSSGVIQINRMAGAGTVARVLIWRIA